MLMFLFAHVFEKEKLFSVLRGDPRFHHLEALVSRGLRELWITFRSASTYKTYLARSFLLIQSKLISTLYFLSAFYVFQKQRRDTRKGRHGWCSSSTQQTTAWNRALRVPVG